MTKSLLRHRFVIQGLTAFAAAVAVAEVGSAQAPPPPAPPPAWYNTGGGNERGFPPNVSDFYQHQRWGNTPFPPDMGSPPGQELAAWENLGGICHITTYVNACYRLYTEGSCKIFAPATQAITNQNWLTIINPYMENMDATLGSVQGWLNAHDDNAATPTCRRPLKYELYIRYPDARLPYYPPPPYGGPGQPPPPPAPVPAAGWTIGSWYRPPAPGGRWKKEGGKKAFDRIVDSTKEGNTVILRLRTLPWSPVCVPEDPTTTPPTPAHWDDQFDSSLWWRGNGGNEDLMKTSATCGDMTWEASGGAFHLVCVAGIDKNARKLWFADPDSNKGNRKEHAGINWNNKPDAPVTARKYHPWQPALNGGDAIPVPPRAGNADPIFTFDYFMEVVMNADGRTIDGGVAANERYRNVVINWVEIIEPPKAAAAAPPAPLAGGFYQHTFNITPGPYANADEVWLLPQQQIDIIPSSVQSYGAMAGWIPSFVGDPMDPGSPMEDPHGNELTAKGLRFERCPSCAALLAGDLALVQFNTPLAWDEMAYDAFFHDPNAAAILPPSDPLKYSVQSYGSVEPPVDRQNRGGLIALNCPGDANADGIIDALDLMSLMDSLGRRTTVDDIIRLIGKWGPCK